MATSGSIQTARRNGTLFYLNWQQTGQSTSGNYTSINWQAGINIAAGGYYWGPNSIQINSIVINGSNRGSGTWGNISGTGNHQLRSGSMNIGHNSNGTKSFSASITGWLWDEGTLSQSGSWSLNTINRYASISNLTYINLTDTGFRVTFNVNATCDLWDYSLNGGAWTRSHTGNFSSSGGRTFSDLASGVTHTVKVRVRRADSGLYTESGTISITTLPQNNFFRSLYP